MAKQTSKSTFGRLLQQAREELGFTQKELASLYGVSLKAIREIEQGREENVTIGTAQKIAAYLGCQVTLGKANFPDQKEPHAVIDLPRLSKSLQSIKKVLQKKYAIEKMALFGSYSRGEATEKSDVDILFWTDKELTISDLTSMEIITSAVLGGKKIDLVSALEIQEDAWTSAQKEMRYV